jgi:hypothetical protein
VVEPDHEAIPTP